MNFLALVFLFSITSNWKPSRYSHRTYPGVYQIITDKYVHSRELINIQRNDQLQQKTTFVEQTVSLSFINLFKIGKTEIYYQKSN